MKLFDAHNHLHDLRLSPHRAAVLGELQRVGLVGAVVNGTREGDWPAVAALAAQHDWIIPSFGLHPWYLAQRTAGWRDELLRRLAAHPRAGIGEIGLDRWIEGHDFAVQKEVFTWQLQVAAERDCAASIHCLNAWGALWEIVREHPVPARGFLLHSFGGPVEMVRGFAERGAFFSFSPYFLHERKAAQREVFREIPGDRLLVETDAPDMSPPPALNLHPLHDSDGQPLNHPANITLALHGLAAIRGCEPAALAEVITANFTRLFGAC